MYTICFLDIPQDKPMITKTLTLFWFRQGIFRPRRQENVGPAKIQISLRICAVWSKSSLGTFWIAKDAKLLHADNENRADCPDEQADLSLRWEHMSEGIVFDGEAYLW